MRTADLLRKNIAAAAVGLAYAVVTAGVSAQVIEPLTAGKFASPSRACILEFSPTDDVGKGGAHYKLMRGDDELWSGARDFALRRIVVTDKGHVGGFAYSKGVYETGHITLVFLGPDGKPIINERIQQSPPPFEPALPTPSDRGVLVDESGGRVLFRIADDQGEEWLTYDITTGRRVQRSRPRELLGTSETCGRLFEVSQIAGSPLVVARFLACTTQPPCSGFAVLDFKGQVAWSKEIDHPAVLRNWTKHRRKQAIWSKILDTSAPGRFLIRLEPDRLNIAYTVKRTDGMWRVKEIARGPLLELSR